MTDLKPMIMRRGKRAAERPLKSLDAADCSVWLHQLMMMLSIAVPVAVHCVSTQTHQQANFEAKLTILLAPSLLPLYE